MAMEENMVSIIAAVIADNSVVIHEHPDYGEMTASTLTPDEMARAVLTAISEAGAVEVQFGLDFGDEVSQQDTLEDVHDERDTILGWIAHDDVQRSDYGPLAPVTRTVLTHVGPWTAVDG